MNTQEITVPAEGALTSPAIVPAGEYLNKLAGERLEHECRQKIAEGYREIVVNFADTEIVNSIGISILLGVIDIAQSKGATVTFSDVKEDTVELFDMLGVTQHVTLV